MLYLYDVVSADYKSHFLITDLAVYVCGTPGEVCEANLGLCLTSAAWKFLISISFSRPHMVAYTAFVRRGMRSCELPG